MAWLDGHTRESESKWPATAMATILNKTEPEAGEARVPAWPLRNGARENNSPAPFESVPASGASVGGAGRDALQALLAFSALHQQVRQRRALASQFKGFESIAHVGEFESGERFVLDEVLQLVAEHGIAITGADGLGIALAENNEIVLRAAAGKIKPDVGARIQRDSAFSGACFRTAQIIRCDDSESDDRVNLYACRQLGARSMVAVPLCGRRRVIGVLEAFSAEPFGFNDSDVRSLDLLAALILGALRPEDEDRFAMAAEAAEVELAAVALPEPPAPAIGIVRESAPEPEEDKHEDAAAANVPVQLQSASEAASEGMVASIEAAATETLPELSAELDLAVAEVAASGGDATANRHPGRIIVLVMVVICTLAGAGFWWKLKNAQLGTVMVRPEQKMEQKMNARPAPAAKPATPAPALPSPAPSSTGLDGHENDIDADSDKSAAADHDSASPQALAKFPHITGIRHWSSSDSSTVVLDLEDQVQYEAHRLANPDRIYFDLHDTALAADLEAKAIEVGDPLLARVRVAQPSPGLTRVVLETKGNSTFSVSLETSPYRLVVQVRKPGTDPKAQINLFPGAAEAERAKLAMAIVVPPPTHEDLQLKARVPKMRIVVDAGHGGWDLGTVGRHGLLEKDVVLEIAQRLAKLLESRLGSEVILTRIDDNYIPLDERAGMANQAQADLFVSVHANYSDLPSARGVETYYTNFFSSPSAKDLETRDNSTRDNSPKSPVAAALSPADLHDRIEQSRRLAASVQRSLYGTLSIENPGLRDRGVKEASYVVLTETAMPGILAEVSFVSSPADEQKLRSDGYREQIAEALYKGIARYAAASRGVKMASVAK